MRDQVVLTASYKPADGQSVADHIDLLALRWSEGLGRRVARQEVIKALLEKGLQEHPISEEEAQRLRAKLPPGTKITERPARPKLRLATVDGQRCLLEEGSGDAGSPQRRDRKHHKAA